MATLSAQRPFKTVQIDQERKIRFNWMSICRFEESYGSPLASELKKDIGARFITALTWAGLLHAEPSLTIRETERRIQSYLNQDGDLEALAMSLLDALVDSGVLGKRVSRPAATDVSGEESAPVDPQPAAQE